jgi:hypothetical protein
VHAEFPELEQLEEAVSARRVNPARRRQPATQMLGIPDPIAELD